MNTSRRTWVGSFVLDCKHFERMVAFWQAALGYERRADNSDDWILLYDPAGAGPNLAFQKDPDGPGSNYWFHLDLYSNDPEREVERLRSLGATLVQPPKEGFDYVTLADPDGNVFDVIETPDFEFGQRMPRRPL